MKYYQKLIIKLNINLRFIKEYMWIAGHEVDASNRIVRLFFYGFVLFTFFSIMTMVFLLMS